MCDRDTLDQFDSLTLWAVMFDKIKNFDTLPIFGTFYPLFGLIKPYLIILTLATVTYVLNLFDTSGCDV
jgi:hypothetical protein